MYTLNPTKYQKEPRKKVVDPKDPPAEHLLRIKLYVDQKLGLRVPHMRREHTAEYPEDGLPQIQKCDPCEQC